MNYSHVFMNDALIPTTTTPQIETGFLNPTGVSCYLNAAFQSLFSSLWFSEALSHISSISPNIDNFSQRFPLLSSILDLYSTVVLTDHSFPSLGTSQSPVSCLSNFADVLRNKVQDISRQQDCHEFLTSLFEYLHEETKCLFTSDAFTSTEGRKSKRDLTMSKSVSSVIFSGTLESRTIKSKKIVSKRIEPFFSLSLEVENFDNILDSLIDFQRPKMIEDSRQYLQHSFGSVPKCLIVHLKKFKFIKSTNSLQKIDKFVRFPRILSISDVKYELMSLLCHVGQSLSSGHWFCYRKNKKTATWQCANDDVIKRVEEREVLSSRSAVLLFYDQIFS
ncbi:hypothetical protein RCL1_004809 [Eukaryota sp. TZLM3-RCL]